MARAVHRRCAEVTHMHDSAKPYVIVAATDYSDSGKLALERAFELAAEKPLVELHVLNVLPAYEAGAVDAAGGAWAGALPTFEECAERLRLHVLEARTAFEQRHGGRRFAFFEKMAVHQRVSVPSEEIAQLAADVEADLVVVGTHGRRGIPRLVLGSVAEGTVRLAPCPVLVVRPKSLPVPGPAIEPPCPRCVEARKESKGKELWCAQHRERHGQRHTYHQGDRVGAETNLPLVVRN
jgi:nucleotide-binding universal stress UspA family protein